MQSSFRKHWSKYVSVGRGGDSHTCYHISRPPYVSILFHAISAQVFELFSCAPNLFTNNTSLFSPWTVPDEYLSRCEIPTIDVSNIDTADANTILNGEEIRNMCGMNLMLDEAIANLTCTLKAHGMQDNTVLIIASDNGGATTISGDHIDEGA